MVTVDATKTSEENTVKLSVTKVAGSAVDVGRRDMDLANILCVEATPAMARYLVQLRICFNPKCALLL